MTDEEKEDERNFSCFGEFGARWKCDNCKNRLACKNFSLEKKRSIYLRYNSKYKGKGHWTRKDQY